MGMVKNVLMLFLFVFSGLAHKKSFVRIPLTYTAMEDHLSVQFNLSEPMEGAMIHLYYMSGDSFLDSSYHATSSSLLSSQSIPGGAQSGNLIFECGLITHAGPHRAYLTHFKDGRRVTIAKSKILYASWPRVLIPTPKKLEMHSVGVDIRLSFTHRICSSLLKDSSQRIKTSSNLVFTPRLEIVECLEKNNSSAKEVPCQVPSSKTDSRIWFSHTLPKNFYQRAHIVVRINCSYWGKEGIFRAYLRTNLDHAPIIARSKPIIVEKNLAYSLKSVYESIFPCLTNDITPILLTKPKCASEKDRIAVWGQEIVDGPSNVKIPSKWMYLGDKRVPKETTATVMIPCSFFSPVYFQVCFKYLSYSMTGISNVTTSLCMSTNRVEYGKIPRWSSWSAWSECSASCKSKNFTSNPIRRRYRFCQFPEADTFTDNAYSEAIVCKGHPVSYEPCDLPQCNNSTSVISDKGKPGIENTLCSCGCVYLIHQKTRDIVIRSHKNCTQSKQNRPVPLHWKLKVNSNYTMKVNFTIRELTCPGFWINLREGESLSDELIGQMKIPRHNYVFSSKGKVLTLEFTSIVFEKKDYFLKMEDCSFVLNIRALKIRKEFLLQKILQKQNGLKFFKKSSWIFIILSLLSLAILSIILIGLCILIGCICRAETKHIKYQKYKLTRSSDYECSEESEILYPLEAGEDIPLRRRKRQIPGNRPWHSLHSLLKEKDNYFATIISPYDIKKAIARALKDKRKTQRIKVRTKPPKSSPQLTKRYHRKSKSFSDLQSIQLNSVFEKVEPIVYDKSIETESNKSEKSKQESLKKWSSVSTLGSPLKRLPVGSSLSSGFSAECDMEYDLYDCHLDNVLAVPGSNFLSDCWVSTDEDLFPEDAKESVMFQSRTSDLTTSITSSVAAQDGYRTSINDINLEDYQSTSQLKRSDSTLKRSTLKAKQSDISAFNNIYVDYK